MADLAKSISILTRGKMGRMSYPIQASNHVFAGGSITVDSSGYAGTMTTAERFIGLCVAEMPANGETVSAAQAGADIEVYCSGEVRLAVSGAAAGDEGKAVFCSTYDNTYSYTPKAFQYVGKVVQYDSSGYVWVKLDPGNTHWTTFTSLADDATLALPDAVPGVVTVLDITEGGMTVVSSAGACVIIGGSTNYVGTDTDAKLCVYDAGTGAYIRNRLGSTKTLHIEWFGSK